MISITESVSETLVSGQWLDFFNYFNFTSEEHNPFELAIFMMTFTVDCVEFGILWSLTEFEDACQVEPEPTTPSGGWW